MQTDLIVITNQGLICVNISARYMQYRLSRPRVFRLIFSSMKDLSFARREGGTYLATPMCGYEHVHRR